MLKVYVPFSFPSSELALHSGEFTTDSQFTTPIVFSMSGSLLQRVRGGEPEGVRKHLLSKKAFSRLRRFLEGKKASKKPPETF